MSDHGEMLGEHDYQAEKLTMFQRLCDRMAWTVDPLPRCESNL